MSRSLKVSVDADLCVGTGECARIASEAFRLDIRERIALVLPTVMEADLADLEDAAMNCPTQAISIEVVE